jgi:hypothetical protein
MFSVEQQLYFLSVYYIIKMSTSDTLSFIRARIKNQRNLSKAIQNIQPSEPEPSTQINQVDVFNPNQTGDYDFKSDFKAIMTQYINDPSTIDELALEIGDVGIREFVLNYQSYIPKLKKIEGQRFNKKLFFNFFQDMLAESINKKGLLVSGLSNNSQMGTPNLQKHSSLMSRNTTPLHTTTSPFQPIITSSPVNPLPSTSPFKSIVSTNVSALNTPSATPVKGNSPQGVIGNQIQQVNTDYNTVLGNAFAKLEANIDINANTVKQIKGILDTTFGLLNVHSDPVTKKQYNKADVSKLLFNCVQRAYTNGDYARILAALYTLNLITSANENDNEYQVLYMSPSDWHASRMNLAQAGNYKGYGVGNLKSHHVVIGNKYYVDRQKLGNGILDIRYARNKHLTNIKPQYIGEGLKQVINKMIDEKKVDKNAYHKLNSQEKHLVRNLNDMFDVNEALDDDESFNEEFAILMGEIRAGNTNLDLKMKAKKYILYGMNIGKFPRNVGVNLLHELD